jgi:hypothetical protein
MIRACLRGERVAVACTMRALLRKPVLAGVLALGVLLPSAASAVTLDEILGMARAGVTDAIILALIDRDKTVFAIEPEQVVRLQRDGVSEAVILALLKSGREEGDQAARADAAANSAWIMASLPTEPLLVVTGHGPDRPNVAHPDGFYSGPPSYFPTFGASRRYYGARSNGTSSKYDVPRQMCVAQMSTARSTKPLSYITECPEVMQPRRLR